MLESFFAVQDVRLAAIDAKKILAMHKTKAARFPGGLVGFQLKKKLCGRGFCKRQILFQHRTQTFKGLIGGADNFLFMIFISRVV